MPTPLETVLSESADVVQEGINDNPNVRLEVKALIDSGREPSVVRLLQGTTWQVIIQIVSRQSSG